MKKLIAAYDRLDAWVDKRLSRKQQVVLSGIAILLFIWGIVEFNNYTNHQAVKEYRLHHENKAG